MRTLSARHCAEGDESEGPFLSRDVYVLQGQFSKCGTADGVGTLELAHRVAVVVVVAVVAARQATEASARTLLTFALSKSSRNCS